jgi:hypothetical protein
MGKYGPGSQYLSQARARARAGSLHSVQLRVGGAPSPPEVCVQNSRPRNHIVVASR